METQQSLTSTASASCVVGASKARDGMAAVYKMDGTPELTAAPSSVGQNKCVIRHVSYDDSIHRSDLTGCEIENIKRLLPNTNALIDDAQVMNVKGSQECVVTFKPFATDPSAYRDFQKEFSEASIGVSFTYGATKVEYDAEKVKYDAALSISSDLAVNIDATNQVNADLLAKITSLRAKIAEQTSILNSLRANKDAANASLTTQKRRTESASTRINSANNAISSLTNDIKTLISDTNKVLSDNTNTMNDLNNVKNAIQQKSNELASLNGKVNELSQKRDAAQQSSRQRNDQAQQAAQNPTPHASSPQFVLRANSRATQQNKSTKNNQAIAGGIQASYRTSANQCYWKAQRTPNAFGYFVQPTYDAAQAADMNRTCIVVANGNTQPYIIDQNNSYGSTFNDGGHGKAIVGGTHSTFDNVSANACYWKAANAGAKGYMVLPDFDQNDAANPNRTCVVVMS